ncbi:hypothetical protein [Sporohalobacter salinus]|uniref:hypothetical protein n=1 Tax=Sporohalobacter salinus TaxID=1494606 RepID=UPI00195F26A6|nr:hypothetical protein [Sporohalobacter salinus]MBM7623670.1 hypothetical protein [Sporohalobacter salinus]
MYDKIRQNKFSLKEVIKTSWRIYKNKFRTILLITLCIYVPINILLFIIRQAYPQMELRTYMDIIRLLEAIIGVIAVMGVTYVVKEYINDKDIGFNVATGKAFSNWRRVFWTKFLGGIIVGLLTLVLIIPGVIWFVYYSFAIQIVILKNESGKNALDYSKDLVKGDWWRIFLIWIFRIGISIGLGFLLSFFSSNILIDLITDTFMDIVDIYFVVIMTVMCLNLDFIKNTYVKDEIENRKI